MKGVATEAAVADLKREHDVTDADLVGRYSGDGPPSLTVTPRSA
jgi:hypothetical protein